MSFYFLLSKSLPKPRNPQTHYWLGLWNEKTEHYFFVGVFPCTPSNDLLHPLLSEKTILSLLKMTSKLFFLEYFGTYLYSINSGFIILKIKNMSSKIRMIFFLPNLLWIYTLFTESRKYFLFTESLFRNHKKLSR